MKTIVSEITGRKDYPVFNQMDNEQIIEYLKQRDWSIYEVTLNSDDTIDIDDGDGGGDTLKIIDVQIVDYRDLN